MEGADKHNGFYVEVKAVLRVGELFESVESESFTPENHRSSLDTGAVSFWERLTGAHLECGQNALRYA